MLISDPRISDLAITLISPNGTRVLLFENRGANSTAGLGSFGVVTNGPSPFPSAFVPFYTNNFDDVSVGPYAAGTTFEGWTVLQDGVTIYPELPAPWLSNNIALLNYGIISNTLPTTNSSSYTLTFEAKHAPYLVGTVAWWPFDGDGSDIFGGFNGLLLGNVKFTPAGEVNEAFTGDGLAARVVVPRAPALDLAQDPGFTIEGWINPTLVRFSGASSDPVRMSDGFELVRPGLGLPTGTNVSGWLVENGPVNVLSSQVPALYAAVDTGTNCLELLGGTVSTNFSTVPGLNYLLTCAWTKNPNDTNASFVGQANISLTGQPPIPLTYSSPNNPIFPNWAHTGVVFRATASITKLTVTGLNPGASGMWFDSVQVKLWDVPKPGSAITNGPSPLVEWYDPTSPTPQGIQLILGGAPGVKGPSALDAILVDTNQQAHVITTDPTVITNGGWQHVALTFDRAANTAQLFVNGAFQSSVTFPTPFTPLTSGDVYFGFHPVPAPFFVGFNGGLDEFGFYNRALTPCEVSAIFHAGSAGKYDANTLSCPANGNLQLLTGAGPISVPFSGGPTWTTNSITFSAGSSRVPIVVTSLDPNLAVDNFVLSSSQTNYSDGRLNFTENTNIALVPIKFAPAPFSVTNGLSSIVFSNDFERAAPGTYIPPNTLPGSINAPAVGARNWTVVNGPVTVISNSGFAATGSNSIALGNGAVQCALPTVPGNRYRLAYSVRGPGMVSWWNGDTEPLSHRAWDILSGNNGAFIDGATNGPGGLVNVNGDNNTLMFPGLIDAADNLASKIELGDPANLQFTNSFTIEGWIKPASRTSFAPEQPEQLFFRGDSRACAKPYYFGLERVTANTLDLIFHIKDDRIADCGIILESSAQPIVAGQWQHVAAVFDANVLWRTNAPWPTNELRLYVNGHQLDPKNSEAFLEDPSATAFVNSGFTGRFPMGQLDPAYSPGVSIGNRSRSDNSEPFYGDIDELSVYGRALTSSEISGIVAAGPAGKADPTVPPAVGLAKVSVLVNNVQIDTGIGDNAQWATRTIGFTADRTNLVLTLQGLLPGTIVDGITLTELPPELNYLPETSLDALTGQDAYGTWTLEIVDNRVGANTPPVTASLLDWQLNFILQPVNAASTVHLQHGIVYDNSLVPGGTQNFIVDVPLWAANATNILLSAIDRALGTPLPVGVFWDQLNPTPLSPARAIVWPPSSSGSKVLYSSTAPPDIIPGQQYYLTITNPNPVSISFAYGVWFDIETLTNCTAASNFVVQAGVPRYFQFDVPTNTVPPGAFPEAVSFYLTGVQSNFTGMGSNLTVVLSQQLPLPDLAHYDYISTDAYTNDNIIMAVTNTTPFPVQTNRWYVGVFSQADTKVPFLVEACVNTAYPTIIPLTNGVPFLAGLTNPFVAPPGPPRQFFFEFQVTNEVDAVMFEMYNLSGNADLVLQRDVPPTMAPYYAGSFQPGTNWDQIVARLTPDVPSLVGNWYVGVYNNEATNVSYTLRAITSSGGTLLSVQEPPVPSSTIALGGTGIMLSWYSVVGEFYQVQALTGGVFQSIPGALIHATTPLTTYLVTGAGAGVGVYRIIHVDPATLPIGQLQIQLWTGNQVRISWSNAFPYGILQYATTPFGPWFDVNLPPVLIGTQYVVFDTIGTVPRYYRLIQ